ncbi:hypothetical protein AB0P37_08430 [Streptomyces antimycoticus]|uniref:hypothetical protein n=1 Tax=Streptomyces antimycoticus TaxID=68175 RepID=UPI003436D873
MSTRNVVEHVLRDYGYSPTVATRIVGNLLDEHAHELAERIREADREVSFSDAFYVGTGMGDAADIIDPR